MIAMEDPRMKFQEMPADDFSFVDKYYIKDNLERNLGVFLRATQLDFANNHFKTYLKNQSGDETYADMLFWLTSIPAELHGGIEYSDEDFTREERLGINSAYTQGGVPFVMQYLESIAPASCPVYRHDQDDERSFRPVILERDNVRVEQITLNETSASQYGLSAGDKIFNLIVSPIADSRKNKTIAQDLSVLQLPGMLRELAKHARYRDIKGIGSYSWLFDTPIAERLKFIRHYAGGSNDATHSLRRRSAWLQLLNADGSLNEQRLKALLRTGEFAHHICVGFMSKETLLREYDKE